MWIVDLFDDKEQNELHYVIRSEDVTQKIIINMNYYFNRHEGEYPNWQINFSSPIIENQNGNLVYRYNFDWLKENDVRTKLTPECLKYQQESVLNLLDPICQSELLGYEYKTIIEKGILEIAKSEFGIEKMYFSYKFKEDAKDNLSASETESSTFHLFAQEFFEISLDGIHYKRAFPLDLTVNAWYNDVISNAITSIEESKTEFFTFEESHIKIMVELKDRKMDIVIWAYQ